MCCVLTLLGSVLATPDKACEYSEVFSGLVGDVEVTCPEKLAENQGERITNNRSLMTED